MTDISDVSAANLLVAFYDVHGRKGMSLSILLSRTPHGIINLEIILNEIEMSNKNNRQRFQNLDKREISNTKKISIKKAIEIKVNVKLNFCLFP
jgi:hypothetical protein